MFPRSFLHTYSPQTTAIGTLYYHKVQQEPTVGPASYLAWTVAQKMGLQFSQLPGRHLR